MQGAATLDIKAELFRETGARVVKAKLPDVLASDRQPRYVDTLEGVTQPKLAGYAFRSFDRRCTLNDRRLCDRPRPELAATLSDRQVFLCGLLSQPLGHGPALVATALLPDLHVSCARGAMDVIPLWRDAAATAPNVTAGLLNLLSVAYGAPVTAEDLAAYALALLGSLAYAQRHWNEPAIPGPRLPLTRDGALFRDVAALKLRVGHTQSFGARWGVPGVAQGEARCIAAVPDQPDGYPQDWDYDAASRSLRVGAGRFAPVLPAVMAYEVSGLGVVARWLDSRMATPRGKATSALDAIRPETWTPAMTGALLELLWTLERLLALEPEQEAALARVAAAPLSRTDELPMPASDEREPPRTRGTAQPDLLGGMS